MLAPPQQQPGQGMTEIPSSLDRDMKAGRRAGKAAGREGKVLLCRAKLQGKGVRDPPSPSLHKEHPLFLLPPLLGIK